MTMWTLDQMSSVRHLGATGHLSKIEIAQSDGLAREYMKEKLARWIVEGARTFAVEAHPGDVTFLPEVDEPGTYSVRIDAYWWTSTLTVEVLGGPSDGTVLDFENAPRRYPLMLPIPPTFSWSSMPKPTDILEPYAARYELGGWFEESRRWAYVFKGFQ